MNKAHVRWANDLRADVPGLSRYDVITANNCRNLQTVCSGGFFKQRTVPSERKLPSNRTEASGIGAESRTQGRAPMGMFSCCSAAPAVKDEAKPQVVEEEAVLNGHDHKVIPCSQGKYNLPALAASEGAVWYEYHSTALRQARTVMPTDLPLRAGRVPFQFTHFVCVLPEASQPIVLSPFHLN